jgi:hypothetical protein
MAVVALAAGCSSASVTPAAVAIAHSSPHLTFTGAVTAVATRLVEVEPTQDADSAQTAAFATQCAYASGGSTGAWSAQITLATPGNEWEIKLSLLGFGDPAPGRYPLWGSSGGAPSGDLGLNVLSAKPIASYLESAGAGSYSYYNPGTRDYATVDKSLSTGTIHVTQSPTVPSNLRFTIDGTWSSY